MSRRLARPRQGCTNKDTRTPAGPLRAARLRTSRDSGAGPTTPAPGPGAAPSSGTWRPNMLEGGGFSQGVHIAACSVQRPHRQRPLVRHPPPVLGLRPRDASLRPAYGAGWSSSGEVSNGSAAAGSRVSPGPRCSSAERGLGCELTNCRELVPTSPRLHNRCFFPGSWVPRRQEDACRLGSWQQRCI